MWPQRTRLNWETEEKKTEIVIVVLSLNVCTQFLEVVLWKNGASLSVVRDI